MKRIVSILVLFVSIICVNLSAETVKVEIDNEQIQQYGGKIGLWIEISSMDQLNTIVALYHTSVREVENINGRITHNRFNFIPFGESYLSSLSAKNIKRRKVTSEPDAFIWPIESFDHISSHFGMRNRKLHEGIDIPVPRGTPVVAAMDGRVVASTYAAGGHGYFVSIEHKDNYFTLYSHNSVNFVKPGDVVKKGQIIGLVGSTGNSTGNHLHFEIRNMGIPFNPADFLPELKYAQRRR